MKEEYCPFAVELILPYSRAKIIPQHVPQHYILIGLQKVACTSLSENILSEEQEFQELSLMEQQ